MSEDDAGKLLPDLGHRDHRAGPMSAPVTLVEFADFQCASCGRAYQVLRDVQQAMDRDLQIVVRHFPQSDKHPEALQAAVAAEAADRQGEFWQMHDRMFEQQDDLSMPALLRHAEAIGLDVERFRSDMTDPDLVERVRADVQSGMVSGVSGTPTFFINSERYDGPVDRDSLLQALRQAMGSGQDKAA